jgi:hypothetical protein
MKALILSFCILFIFTKCSHTRYVTEQFIKNEIEKHENKEFSSIRIYSIYKKKLSDVSFIEFSGYKCNNEKKLIITVDKLSALKKSFKEDETKLKKIRFVVLNEEQCKAIINSYQDLFLRIENTKQKRNEDVYSDYTVSKDLFLSIKRMGKNQRIDNTDIWIDGDKYTVVTYEFINKLNKFIEY